MIGRTSGEITEAYSRGEMSPVTVAQEVLAAAEIAGERLNAVSTLNVDQALEQAEASARRWAAGEQIGPMDGVPVSIKDSIHVAGLKRWHGSAVHDHLPPSTHDGAPTKRLKEAGAVLFGKTSMPDFGLMSAGLSSQFGVIANPWDVSMSPGGSSSGAAALLAAGVGPAAVGTDLGGSIRTPAAQCGVVGLKPTQGRVAYDPPKLVGSAGPLGRSVDDVIRLLEVIGAPDPADHLSLPGRFERAAGASRLDGITVGLTVAAGDGMQSVEAEVSAVVGEVARLLERLGARIVDIDPVMTVADHELLGRQTLTKGAWEFAAASPEARTVVPDGLRAALEAVREMTAVEYLGLERGVESVRARWAAQLSSVDLVLSPVLPIVGFPATATGAVGRDNAERGHLMFTQPYNLTGMPAGAVPAGVASSGLPIGAQIGGRRFADALVLDVMQLVERDLDLKLPYPDISLEGVHA